MLVGILGFGLMMVPCSFGVALGLLWREHGPYAPWHGAWLPWRAFLRLHPHPSRPFWRVSSAFLRLQFRRGAERGDDVHFSCACLATAAPFSACTTASSGVRATLIVTLTVASGCSLTLT